MGEPIWTNLRFGGKIKRSDMERLSKEMFDEGGAWEHISLGKIPREKSREIAVIEHYAAQKEPAHGICGTTNYGLASSMCELLDELGLHWTLESEATGEYDATLYIKHPGKEKRTVFVNADHEPVASLNYLLQCKDKGKSLDAIIKEMVEEADGKLPRIEIVED